MLAKYDVTGATTDFRGGESSWSAIPTGRRARLQHLPREHARRRHRLQLQRPPAGCPTSPSTGTERARRASEQAPPGSRTPARPPRVLHPSSAHPLVHTVELDDAGSANARLVFTARDAQTLAAVEDAVDLGLPGRDRRRRAEAADRLRPGDRHCLLRHPARRRQPGEATVRRATWDDAAHTYVVDQLGSLGEFASASARNVEGIVWNAARASWPRSPTRRRPPATPTSATCSTASSATARAGDTSRRC